jgi:signal transduction histidine kinase
MVAHVFIPKIFLFARIVALEEQHALAERLSLAMTRVASERAANDTRRKFLRTVCHDVRVPLNVLSLGERRLRARHTKATFAGSAIAMSPSRVHPTFCSAPAGLDWLASSVPLNDDVLETVSMMR